jgi:tetratricopeptide (TPR) repeat protein
MVSAGPAVAQSDAKTLIDQAYQKTKKAKTVSDLTTIIELCQRAQQADATESQRKYLAQLLGWSHNKRGEAIIEQSLAALQGDDQPQAIALDAKALADFEKSVRYEPKKWKSLHNRGVGYALIDEFVKAIEDFDAVIKLKPEYTNAWFNRAEIRYELDQLDLAIEDYTEVIQRVPGDFGAYTGRGHANFRAGRIRVALDDYEYAANLNPSNADALVNRGRARQKLGLWELAAEDFREAIERDGKSAPAFREAAWLMATCPDARYRNQKLGLHAAKKAVELAAVDALTAQHLDTLAAALANAGQFEEAQARQKQALQRATAEEAPELQRRLALYKGGEPYHEPLPTEAVQGR